MSILDYYREKFDSEKENRENMDIPMTDDERIAAQNKFNEWKDGNRKIEEDIDRFMRDKVETITAIMELSDRMHVVNGDKVVIEDKKQYTPSTEESEKIRLMKEQNELLKKQNEIFKEILLKNIK